MATQNNIDIKVNVTDGGSTAKATKDAEKYKKTLEDTGKAAASIGTGSVGGTAGSRAAAAAAAAPIKTASTMSAPSGSAAQMSDQDYNRARGAAGATGASARDFAKQSEGLGGLVRLYATYAANLYAVGAAFRALSSAMDTSNMVKGLDQLGASSGMALGNLSKRLVEATDGAISLRDSMEAVAKSSAAGMSSKQILEMGKVAKQASQALGIDMSDAMSRITRAATKLEPELVDELGLFTKTGKASEDYAKSVGKTVAELTDFEKRMAYTNALIAEGSQKFGEIKLDTNPYSKLLATITNISQASLELVNKFIAPLVNYLSQSPGALVAVLGSIGTILIKQAVPAIGQFKSSLESAAKEAASTAAKRAEDAIVARKAMDQKLVLMAGAAADAQVAIVDAAEEKARSFREKGISKNSSLYALLSKDLHDITEAELKRAEATAKALDTKGLKEQAEVYRQTTTAVRNYQAEEENLKLIKAQQAEQLRKDQKSWTVFGSVQQNAISQQVSATSKAIVSNAAYQGSIMGVAHAFSVMNAEVAAAGLQGFSKFSTLAKGGIASVAGAAATLGSRLMGMLNWVGLGIAAFSLLDGILSKNSKHLQEFSQSTDRLTSSGDSLNSTLDKISSKPLDQQFNSASINAAATAILEVSDATSQVILNLQKADKSASGWDRFIDGFKSVVGADLRTTFSKTMSDTILGSLNKLAGSAEASDTKKKIASILSIDPTASEEIWQQAFASIAQDSQKLSLVDKAMKDLSNSMSISAAKAKELDDALKASGEKFKAIVDKFKVKDEVALFGESLIAASQKTALALETPEKAIHKLREISLDFNKLKLFGQEDQANILKYADSIATVSGQYQYQLSRVRAIKQELYTLQSKEQRSLVYDKDSGKQKYTYDAQTRSDIAKKEAELKAQEAALSKTEADVRTITSKFPELASNQFIRGAKTLEASIEAALGKGSYALQTAVLNTLGDLPGVSDERYKIAVAQLNSEAALLQVQKELIRATLLNAAETKLAGSRTRQYVAQSSIQEVKRGGGSPTAAMLTDLEQADKAIKDQEEVIKFYRMDAATLLSSYKTIKTEVANGNKEVQAQAEELYGYISSVAGIVAKEREISDKKAEQNFVRELGNIKEEYSLKKKMAEDTQAAVAAEIKAIDIREKFGKLTATEALNQRSIQEQKQIEATYDIKRLATEEKIAALKLAEKTSGSEKVRKSARTEISRLEGTLTTTEKEKQAALDEERLKSAQKRYDIVVRDLDLEYQLYNIRKIGAQAEEDALLQKKELSLQSAKDTGKYTKEYQANLDYELQLFKINQEAIRQEVSLTQAYNTTKVKLEAEKRKEYETSGGRETARTLEISSILSEENTTYNKQLSAIKLIAAAKLDAAAATKKWNDEQNTLSTSLESLRGLDVVFKGLGGTFEGLGSKIADTVLAFDALNKQQQANANSLADIEKRKKAVEESGDLVGEPLLKEEADLRKKIQKDEIAGYAKTVSAAKAMFKEKTAAHKALGAIEKVLHLQRMAMDLKEMVQKLFTDNAETASKLTTEATQTGATEAGFLARTGTYISEIFAKFTATMGPWGWAAAAAVVAALFGGSGKGGGAKFAPTAEQRQETQGTAMGWDSEGNKVQVRRGVFGDTDAKSESIANSLELISANSVDGLDYDNKMLRALKDIKDAISVTARGLYRIPGLTTGSLFGNADVRVSTSGIQGLFGSSTTKEITDSGLKLKGTFLELASAMGGSIEGFETIKKTKKSSGILGIGGKTSVSFAIETLGLDPKDVASIASIFGYGEDLLRSMADLATVSQTTVTTILSGLKVDEMVSLRGLTGEEFEKELMSVFGAVLDDASLAIFSSFEQFANFGEGMLETVERVLDTNTKVKQALKNIGLDSQTFGFEITENLVGLADGLENFLDRVNFFSENFLTEEERLVPVTSAVSKELNRLAKDGYTSADGLVDTRDEFKKLVQGLDTTTESGAAAYTALMKLAPGFDAVMKATEKLDEAKASERKGLEAELERAKLLGDSNALRELEISKLDESNRSIKREIYYWEDLKTARDDAINKLGSMVTAFRDFAKQVRDFRSSLLLGNLSTDTPLQKLATAQTQFQQTYEKALAGDKDAMSKLTGTASTYLEQAKISYASSSEYSNIFASVSDKLAAAEASASTTADNAELQLNALKSQTLLLQNIDAGIAKLAGLSPAPIQTAAAGGWRQGITLVGEEGPEFVDFQTPGRVYTADQTAGMFSPVSSGNAQQAVVAELQALRKEVAQLRKEQQQQTGDMINTNYDASQAIASHIVEAVSQGVADAAWQNRSAVTLR